MNAPETEMVEAHLTEIRDGAEELAEARVALVKAREQLSLEVQRREEAEAGFDRFIAAEREQLRKKLHDGLGQMLTSVSFLASSLRYKLRTHGIQESVELDEIVSLVNEAIAESKSIAAVCNHESSARPSM